MEVNTDELASIFADLSDAELLGRHASGELTDIAYSILEKELARREIPIPERPSEAEIETRRPQSLRAHWEGKASLASAYWFIWVTGSFVFGILVKLTETQGAQIIGEILFFVYIVYLVFAAVSVWRCAWNTSWKGWRYIARTIVALPLSHYWLD